VVTDYEWINKVLVGLEGVDVLGVEEEAGGLMVVGVRLEKRPRCEGCGGEVQSMGEKRVRLVDLPGFGGPVRLEWSKRRWQCPDPECGVGSFTEQADWIAPEGARLTSRAASWATLQIGRGRTVSEIAEELGCDWRMVAEDVNRGGKP